MTDTDEITDTLYNELSTALNKYMHRRMQREDDPEEAVNDGVSHIVSTLAWFIALPTDGDQDPELVEMFTKEFTLALEAERENPEGVAVH